MRSILIVAIVLLTACVSEPLPDGFKDSDDFDPVAAAKNRISLGLTYLQNGNFSQAKFNLDKALQFAPRLADAHFSMAYYYQQVDEKELADDAYQKALAFAPKNPDIANSYGAFLCAKGDYKEAKKYFLKAVNSTNYISTAETYENLALCSQSQGQIDDALTYLQSAINHQPSRGKSLLLLVELQMQQQQWKDAQQNLRRYEKVARVTPDTLWKSIEIENALNNGEVAQGYGDMLVRMYPRHPRTLAYIKSKRDVDNIDATGKITRQLKPRANVLVSQSPRADSVPTETAPSNTEQDVVAAPPKDSAQIQQPGKSPKLIANENDEGDSSKEKVEPTATINEQAMEAESPDEGLEASADIQNAVIEPEGNIESEQSVVEQTVEANTLNLEVPETAELATAEQGAGYHIVQKGENLYRISLRYNVKMKRLLEWNGLQEGEAIFIGKRLIVVDPATVEQE